jgi:hypothetical protein
MHTFLLLDVRDVEGTVNLLFPCAQARLEMLPKRLSSERGYSNLVVFKFIKKNFSFFFI